MARKTTPESLYGTDRDLLREQERKNEILAQLAGETYTPPGNIPKGGYILKKRALDAAQKENELLGDIAEFGSMTDQITDAVTDWLDDNVDPVGSAVVVDSTLTISGAAADAKVTGDAVADLKTAFILEDDCKRTFSVYSNFINAYLNENGTQDTTKKYRVSCSTPITFDRDIEIDVATGFRWGYMPVVGGTIGSWSGWKTAKFTMPSETSFIVQIARTTENTSEVANVSEFTGAVTFINSIGNNKQAIIDLKNDLKTVELSALPLQITASIIHENEGYIPSNGGKTTNSNFTCSNLYYAVPGMKISYKLSASAGIYIFAVYNSGKQIIAESSVEGSGWSTYIEGSHTFVDGEEYFSVCGVKEYDVTTYSVSLDYPIDLKNRLDEIHSSINDLQSDINDVSEKRYAGIDSLTIDENYFVQGTITSSGAFVTANNRAATEHYFDVSGYALIKANISSGYAATVFFYNAKSESNFNKYVALTDGVSVDIVSKYVRLWVKKTSEANITPDEAFANVVFSVSDAKIAEVENLSREYYPLQESLSLTISDISYEVGLIRWDGAVRSQDTGCYTSDFQKCFAGDVLKYKLSAYNDRFIVATYTEGKSFIRGISASGADNLIEGTYTFQPGEVYFRFCGVADYISKYYIEYGSFPNNITLKLKECNDYSDKVYVQNGLPDYVYAEAQTVIGKIKEKMSLGNPAVFGFNTDQHINVGTASEPPVMKGLNALKFITEKTPFNVICLGGDDCGYTGVSLTVYGILDAIMTVYSGVVGSNCPIVSLAGNHDAWQNNNDVTSAQIFNTHFRNSVANKFVNNANQITTNGYIDDESVSIRFIFVDSAIATSRDYDIDDVNAFLSNALSNIPANYSAIIISHHPLANDLSSDFNNPLNCNAVITEYANKIIMCLNGHAHKDASDTKHNVLFVETTTAGMSSVEDDYGRVVGTAGETAQDIFIVDQTEKKIYAVRYGAGYDREFDYDSTSGTFGEIVS